MIPSEKSLVLAQGNYPDYPTGAQGENVGNSEYLAPEKKDLQPEKKHDLHTDKQDLHLEKWYDNYEVMKMFHISQRTLQTLRSNGKLPFAKLGNKCFYREQDLQQMMMESFRDSRVKFAEPKVSDKKQNAPNKEQGQKGGSQWR